MYVTCLIFVNSNSTCCDNLEEPPALMKMGLSLILVGHVNFLLGAVVHGIVLQQINLHEKVRGMGYAISNVVTLFSGMLGVIVGILAIILSKNKKSKPLTWSLFSISLVSSFMAGGSTIGLFVSLVKTIVNGRRVLLTHCRFPNVIGYSSITNECPFDLTRVYVSVCTIPKAIVFFYFELLYSCQHCIYCTAGIHRPGRVETSKLRLSVVSAVIA
uniref:Transmembrane protein 54b n=1 Tax=Xiphophorus couchianus TaxID=32473 RepID=A0A3B5KWM9_9TELE